jgi:serine/threonine-protein kinase RsbW
LILEASLTKVSANTLPNHHKIHVNTDLNELRNVLAWFETLEQHSVSDQDWLQCQIALAEGFTNVVRHAHKHLSEHIPIDIDISFFPDSVEMRIWDHGPPFNLMSRLDYLAEGVDAEAESGRGLLLLQKIASDINYLHLGNGHNCLVLTKNRT